MVTILTQFRMFMGIAEYRDLIDHSLYYDTVTGALTLFNSDTHEGTGRVCSDQCHI